MPRPTKLTPEVHAEIVKLTRAGLSAYDSARATGIGKRTFMSWMERGRDDDGEVYVRFYEDVEKARSFAKAGLVSRIVRASDGDWKAAAWLLERKFPAEYGRVQRLEHSGGDRPVKMEHSRVDLSKLTREELQRFRELSEKAGDETKVVVADRELCHPKSAST